MNVVVYTVEEAAQILKISRWKVVDLIRTISSFSQDQWLASNPAHYH